ncbi:hypothetical protein LTR53_014392 [Teratosphaeriaceae sp. CCFEE 6253]|nr:hypothetical protein LTR53_014392 [Teratosphaeriaceae sp. CCFEE 6253]
MILSSYRNPPYRTPVRKDSSISPPPGPSPKRKRTDSHNPASDLPLQGQSSHTPNGRPVVPETPPESPPTSVVVGRLRDLEISQSPLAAGTDLGDRASPRKRLMRDPHSQALDEEVDRYSSEVQSTPEGSSQPAIAEISETPDWRMRLPSSPPPPTSSQHMGRPHSTAWEPPARPARLRSPPPTRSPAALETHPASTTNASDTPHSPSSDSSMTDPSALTWQDHEITGQDIDISTDDDGEGINGIGFRPTAAIAYARSQRRKQQVNEWKAREAREARQRRIERRRGAAAAHAHAREGGRSGTRSVRFEGVG